MNPQNYVQDKACEQADTFSYTFTVQHVKYNLILIFFHMNPNLQSILFKSAALGVQATTE